MSSGIRKACRRCTCRYYCNTNKSRSLIRGSSTLRNLAHIGRSKSMVPYFLDYWGLYLKTGTTLLPRAGVWRAFEASPILWIPSVGIASQGPHHPLLLPCQGPISKVLRSSCNIWPYTTINIYAKTRSGLALLFFHSLPT